MKPTRGRPCADTNQFERDRRIAALNARRAGTPVEVIARLAKVTRQTVYLWCARAESYAPEELAAVN